MRQGKGIILVENPLTGNTSFAAGLGLKDSEVARWEDPKEARKRLGSEWSSHKKLILVRDPVDRFLSGATLSTMSSTEELQKGGASEEFIKFISESLPLKKGTPVMQTRSLMEWLTKNGLSHAPIWMQPQAKWLCMRFDVIVATHTIAEYFNHAGSKLSVNRANLMNSDPSRVRNFRMVPEMTHLLRALYAEDYSLLERLLLWTPNEGEVRLITGACALCRQWQEEGKLKLVDMTKGDEEETPEKLPKKKKAKRKA